MCSMSPLSLFIAAFALLSLNGVFGAPSCANGLHGDACVKKCRTKLGWPGHTMCSDHWGLVVKPSGQSLDDVIASACGSSGNGTSSGPASAAPYTRPAVTYTSSTSSNPTTSPSVPSEEPSAPVSNSHSSTSSPFSTPRPASSHTPTPTPSSTNPSPATSSNPASSTPSSTGSVSSADIDAYLLAHNNARKAHGANPLTWNNTLSTIAQQWVDGCIFKHSGGPYGENLATGTGDFTIDNAIQLWVDEAGDYHPSNPVASHWTQVVWKSTTELGCAVQKCKGIFDSSYGLANFYTCEYSPAGNVIGQFAENVQK